MKPDVAFWIYSLYAFAATAWTFLVLVLKLFEGYSFFLVAIPYIAFAINIANTGCNEDQEEANMFQGTFLTIGLIVIVSVMAWFGNMGVTDPKQISLVLLCLGFSIFSHIDLGIPKRFIVVYRHYRSILQTFSITLFLIVIANYFIFEENPFVRKIQYKKTFETNLLVPEVK